MSLLDWSKVQQRASLTDRPSSSSIPRPSIAPRHIQRRKSVQGTPSMASSTKLPPSRHSLQVDDFLSRPSDASSFEQPQYPPRPDYDIVWNSSSLGIAFRCNSKNLAVIRRIEPDAPSHVLQQTHVGDVLLATNGEPSINFDATMDRLRALDHPIVLTFGPPSRTPFAPPARAASMDDSSSFHSSSDNALAQTTPNRTRPNGAPSLVSTDMNESIVSRDVEDSDNLHHITYSIEWQEGLKLGVSIIKMGNIPVVKERTVPAALAPPALAQIQAHDQLISIQGHSTATLGYQASIVLLRDAKKPVHLEFRRKVRSAAPTPPLAPTVCTRESDYSLVWEDGPLGLTLKKDKVYQTMVVARLNGDGLAARCNLISLGDRLVSVSNVKVHELGLRGTMEFLKAVPKPATLVFHRPASDSDMEPRTSRSSSLVQSSSIASSDDLPQPSNQVDEPKESAPVDAKAAELDAPEDGDLVTPLVSHQASPVSSPTPSSKDRLLPRSNTSASTYSDLDDSGLSATRLYAAPPSNDAACGPPMIEIVWASGPLGLTLKQSGSSVVVSRVTGKGEAPNLRDLQMGDILVAVNDMDTSGLDLDVATTLLKSLAKPARLRFMLQTTEEDL